MSRLSAAQRRRLPRSDFAIPERAPGPGSYPVPDEEHAHAALGEVEAHGSATDKRRVRAKVRKRFGIGS